MCLASKLNEILAINRQFLASSYLRSAMRALFLASISAVLLSACLTSQENPNYEHSTVYRGDPVSSTQYASAPSVDISNATYDAATSQYVFPDQATTTAASYESAPVTYQPPTTYEAAPVYAQGAPVTSAPSPSFNTSASSTILAASAPTDAAYNAQEVTGTPGFMALQQSQQQTVAQAEVAPVIPSAQAVTHAPLRAAGTPVPYDYSRNLITADTVTTDQQLPDSVRVLGGASQNYTLKPGDTVYSLSRRTCVGVNVIQSMNGLNADYGINIGQSIQLPASVC